jgi:hypothetical protein
MLLWDATLHQEKCYFPGGNKACRRSSKISLKSERGLLEVEEKMYKTVHRGEVVQALEKIREIYGHICSVTTIIFPCSMDRRAQTANARP